MCIVFWALDHPDYGLILCSNRDEYLNRPTRDARFHSFAHEADVVVPASILSGIDEVGGGTWFGITRTGRIALLTNITEPATNLTSSRGILVSSFLLLSDTTQTLEEQVQKLYPREAKYTGFNLLLLAPRRGQVSGSASLEENSDELRFDASFVTNSGAGGAISSRPLSTQEKLCGGFSNGVDGKGGNEWPKVKHGMKDFSSVLQEKLTENELTDRLFDLLSWRSPEPVKERIDLRKTVHVAPFQIGAQHTFYGTRLSTVLLVRRDGQVTFIERDVWKEVDGKVQRSDPSSQREYRFKLDSVSVTS